MLVKSIDKAIDPCIQMKLPAQLIMRQSTLNKGGD
jgi:hypothetical protein